MAQLRQQSSPPLCSQQSAVMNDSADEDDQDVRPMGRRKALRLQHMNRLQQGERQKRPRDSEVITERKPKRARYLIELQEDEDDVHHPAEESTVLSRPMIIIADTTESSPVEIMVKPEPQHSHSDAGQGEKRHELHCFTPVNTASEQLQIVEAPKQIRAVNDDILSTLLENNQKLMEENASLKQQLQRQKADTRVVLLLQEQVQRLQQRELELMRALISN
ncbi:hypothetical protein L914_07008 [Phytophthora nicotianae]|uniref:Uncharacterized protein n=1 Tax=Phytophthora nicotianae TaxID=4792 RepID=W2NIN2_PHYNI|nr:hypothetical protein L914_07008 [Phytophthora nicotianae]